MKPKQMPDGQSGTSEEDGQKLLVSKKLTRYLTLFNCSEI